MPYHCLNDFIQKLNGEDELRVIDQFVSPELEITEITDRISKSPGGGKALLFTNNGTPFPVLINAFGSLNRMCLALGVSDLDATGRDLKAFMDSFRNRPASFLEKLKLLPRLGEAASYLPITTKRKGQCQQVVYMQPDLGIFPILKCWPFDGGKFITLPMVHTKDPHTGIRNVGMYRMQVLGACETAMHWHRHKTGARHFEEYRKLGKRMPVAVALGGDPAYTYAATAPLPDQLDEYILAGFLRKKRVELVKCLTQDIEVPADADIVIEGYVDPSEDFVLEGPFGDHTGFYSLADYYPRFHVTCITQRENAVYPATIVGIPPQEDAWIARATEKIFLFPIRLTVVPELVDLHMPDAGVAHNLALVKIKKSYPGQARKVMNALWGAGQMMFNKVMIVTDSDIPLENYRELLADISRHVKIPRDLHLTGGPMDVLDHAAQVMGYGGKLGIDATRKLPEEESDASLQFFSDLPNIASGSLPGLCDLIAGQVSISFSNRNVAILLALKPSDMPFRDLASGLQQCVASGQDSVFILVDEPVDLVDMEMLLWYALNNIDARRDLIVIPELGTGNSSLVVDGRKKRKGHREFVRDWPNVIISSEKTIAAIDILWEKLKIGIFVSSPSLRFRKLVENDGAEAK